MNQKTMLLALVFVSLSVDLYAQPAEVVDDGFSDKASIWLKQNPSVKKCADKMVRAFHQERKKRGLDETTSSAQYGEFIGVCAAKNKRPANSKKLQGDQVDNNPNAKPNNPPQAKNKRDKKAWQDENGFMHFPDGSMSSGPID